ncbi:E3 ubiquitin-protein ligase ATL6-like protein [Drosera capensis]
MTIHHEAKLTSSVAAAALLLAFVQGGAAQSSSSSDPNFAPNLNLNPSMGVIIFVVVVVFLFVGFFSIYVRLCTGPASSSTGASLRGFTTARSRRAPRGLDPSVLNSFPTFEYGTVKARKIGKGALECAVCLTEFDDHEIVRMIPKCDHVFHTDCIDAWLAAHTTCPVCRADLSSRGEEKEKAAMAGLGLDQFGLDHSDAAVIDGLQDDEQEIELTESMDRPLRPAQLPQPELLDLSQHLNRNRTRRTPSKWIGRLITRSNSTGHVAVKRWESMDRFTLRLPDEVRRELMTRGKVLTRSASCLETVPRVASLRRGNRASGGEGSGWRGRFGGIRSDRSGRSDRWVFGFTTPSWLTRWGSVKGGGDVAKGDVAGVAEVHGSRGQV